MLQRLVALGAWTFLVALGALGLGLYAADKQWAPWTQFQDIRKTVRSLRATGAILPDLTYFRRSPRTSDDVHTVFDADAVTEGFWAVTRFDGASARYVVDLIDADGAVVHSWPVNYANIFGNGAPDEFVHGTGVLSDGSLVANFDTGFGMARIDGCGDALWTRTDGTYHHEIAKGEDGVFWTWFAPGGATPHGNLLFGFDPVTGEPADQIHLVDDVVLKDAQTATMMTIPEGFTFQRDALPDAAPDTFHPNDADPLPASMAAAFPMFEAGDLLISLRNIDLVGVVDADTHALKWAAHGPWLMQHDPDWQADGTITVFSNNTDRRRSSLIRIDPATGESGNVFATPPVFDSYIMGTHQRLPSGNWLIVSSMEGRVIEVTPSGDIVREYSNVLNEGYNALIPHAEWLAPDFFETMPSCPG